MTPETPLWLPVLPGGTPGTVLDPYVIDQAIDGIGTAETRAIFLGISNALGLHSPRYL